jgi:hypothetical protein
MKQVSLKVLCVCNLLKCTHETDTHVHSATHKSYLKFYGPSHGEDGSLYVNVKMQILAVNRKKGPLATSVWKWPSDKRLTTL